MEGEDDAHEVTAGCYVTLKITLKRKTLMDPVVSFEYRLFSNEELYNFLSKHHIIYEWIIISGSLTVKIKIIGLF